jgi:hypothetical protein
LLPAVLFTLLVLLVLEHAVEPRLFDRRRYNPLPIAIITIGLADVLGLPGLLLGPPLAVSAQSVGRYLVRRRLTRAAAEPVEVSELRQRLFELEQRLANHPAQTRNVAPLLERLKRLLEDPALNADGSRPVGARSPG